MPLHRQAVPGRAAALREWVLASLYPAADRPAEHGSVASTDPPRLGPLHRLWVRYLLAFIGLTTVLLLRVPGALRTPFAEDGSEFLHGVAARGCSAWATPYAGYLHLAPRTIACVASFGPFTRGAEVMALGAAMLEALVLLAVFRAAGGHLPGWGRRAVLVALWAGSPLIAGEIVDVSADVQWILLPGVFWLLLWRDSWFGTVLGTALAFVAAASSALALLLLPLAVIRLLVVRTWRDRLLPMAFGLGMALQVIVILRTSRQPSMGKPDLITLHNTWIYRVIVPGVFGPTRAGSVLAWHEETVSDLLLVVLAVLVLAALLRRGSRTFVVVSIATACVVGSVTIVRAWSAGLAYLGTITNFTDGDRYLVTPVLLLAGPLLVAAPRSLPELHRRREWPVTLACTATAVVLAVGIGTDFRLGQQSRNGTPSWASQIDAARNSCATGARFATMTTAPKGWAYRWPCTDLPR
jgi:hypothetical protein